MAPRYDRMMALAEWLLFGDGRQWACAQATGRVLEVAVGTGRNLACYPADVDLTGVELSPSMLAQAPEPRRCTGRSTCDSVTPST